MEALLWQCQQTRCRQKSTDSMKLVVPSRLPQRFTPAVFMLCHTNTYKVLGGLSMQEFEEEGAVGEDGLPNKKRRRIVGVNTLERNEANITQTNIDADEQNDPMFRRMAQAFDAGGAKGLLLSHLPIAEDLSLTFNCDVPMNKASEIAKDIWEEGPQEFPVNDLGIGDPAEFLEKIAGSR